MKYHIEPLDTAIVEAEAKASELTSGSIPSKSKIGIYARRMAPDEISWNTSYAYIDAYLSGNDLMDLDTLFLGPDGILAWIDELREFGVKEFTVSGPSSVTFNDPHLIHRAGVKVVGDCNINSSRPWSFETKIIPAVRFEII